MAVATYTKTGSKASTAATLPKEVFGLKVESTALLKQAYETYRSNARSVNAKVKDRSEVRGGGRKPWKQKGTGRARHGSNRSPIWTGGGITFGPTGNQNYTKALNKKAKRQAIRQALSLAAENDVIKVVADVDAKDGKTKSIATLLDKLGCDQRSTILVVDEKTDELMRATNNIPYLTVIRAQYLSVYTVLTNRNIVFTKKALDSVKAWLGDKS